MLFTRWRAILLVFLTIIIILFPLSYFKSLEAIEFGTLDKLFQLRPSEVADGRIVIVGITEDDIQKYQTYPFSDGFLADLLDKIRIQKPIGIGLDIVRDVPVPPGTERLHEIFKTTPNLIGAGIIGALLDPYSHDIAFPPILKAKGQVGDVSGTIDSDRVVRRGVMYPLQDGSEDSKIPALSVKMAYLYLKTKGIEPQASSEGWMQLKDTVFYPYQEEEEGYQVIINWRNNFPRQVSIADVVEGKLPKNFFKDKIVFIGGFAISLKDVFFTPFSQKYGVEIQASMASSVISAVLDERKLLRGLDNDLWYSILWFVVASIAVSWNKFRWVFVSGIVSILGAIAVTWIAFNTFGWWLPLIYPLAAIIIGVVSSIVYIYIWELKNAKALLESRVEARTLELSEVNRELASTVEELKQTQQKLLSQEKLAALGTLTAGLAHEISNPVFGVRSNVRDLEALKDRIDAFIAENRYFLLDLEDFTEGVIDNLAEERVKIEEIKRQLRRISSTLQTILAYARREIKEPESIDLNGEIEEAIELVKRTKESEIEIEIISNYDRSIGQISIIENEFYRALVNLIENAWNVLIDKKEREEDFQPRIEITTEKVENNVVIKIKDNGLGIEEELKSRIFDPFFSTKKSKQGTGLGLYFVWEIVVNEHGGTISVESVEGEETEFVVKIPIRERNNRD